MSYTFLLALPLTSACVAGAPPSGDEETDGQTGPLVAGATYRIVSVGSGLALDVGGQRTDDGAAVLQWPYHGGANQIWRLKDAGGGRFNLVSQNSDKCLDVTGRSQSDGAPVEQWGCWNGPNQQWTLVPASNGAFEIVNANSGKCLDVAGQSKAAGARVEQWGCWNGANQQWKLEQVGGSTCSAGGAATVTFTPRQSAPSMSDIVGPFRGYTSWFGSQPGTMKAVDAYSRLYWRDIEKSEGVYDLTTIKKQMDALRATGGRFGFRIMAACTGCWGPVAVPDYLTSKAKMPHGWYTQAGEFVPDWNDPYFLDRATQLLRAIGQGVDGDPALGYVDVGIYGNWGELHPGGIVPPANSGATWLTSANARRVVDMHAEAFPKTQIICGMANTELLQYALGKYPTMGWRADGIGSHWYTGVPSFAQDRWKTAPVFFEFVGADADYPLALQQVTGAHGSMVGLNGPDFWPGNHMSASAYDAAVKLGQMAGFHIVPANVKLPQTLHPGDSAQIQSTWTNTGLSPTYEAWSVAFEFRRQGSNQVAFSTTSTLDLRKLLPGQGSVPVGDCFSVPQNAAAGTYEVSIAALDPRHYRQPLPLSITGRTADGRYVLGTVTVAAR